MTLRSDDPRPPYLLAADQLRAEITSGRLKPGDRLPSSRALRDNLGIAYATVHSALRVLRDEGLIYSVHGRGSYVADPADPPSGTIAWARSFLKDAGYPDEQIQDFTGRLSEAAVADPVEVPEDFTDVLRAMRNNLASMATDLRDLRSTVENLDQRVQGLERPDDE